MSHLTYPEAVVVGALQGVTELFPVSSLGHSVLLPALLGAYLAVRLLTRYFETRTLTPFAVYCAAAGLASLAWLTLNRFREVSWGDPTGWPAASRRPRCCSSR